MQKSHHPAGSDAAASLPLQVARLWQQQIVTGIEMSQRLNESIFSALPRYFEDAVESTATAAIHRSPAKRRRGNGAAKPKRHSKHRKSH